MYIKAPPLPVRPASLGSSVHSHGDLEEPGKVKASQNESTPRIHDEEGMLYQKQKTIRGVRGGLPRSQGRRKTREDVGCDITVKLQARR